MNISDLSYLEVVSEASSIVGGETSVNANAAAQVTGPGDVAVAATTITNVEASSSTPGKNPPPPINLDKLFNEVDKIVAKATF